MFPELAHVLAGDRENIQLSLRSEKIEELAAQVFVLGRRTWALRLGLDLAEVIEPLPDGERAQSFAAVHAGDDLADNLARPFLGQRPFTSKLGCALPLHTDFQGVAPARLLGRFLEPSPGRVCESAIPKWRARLSVPFCFISDNAWHVRTNVRTFQDVKHVS